MAAIGDVFLRVRADLKEFEAEIQAAARRGGENAAQTMGTAFGKAGKSMQNFGRTLTTNVTLPVAALGLAAAKVGSDFEDTMNQLVGLANVPRSEIAGIREELLALAPVVGKTPQELAEGFYFVASAGFKAGEAMDVIETAARASAAGLGETQDVAKVLGLTINAYGKENITAARAADILVAAVADGTAEASQFAGVRGNVVPTAAQMGVTFDEVTAALAGMTLSGVGVEEATTSLNQVLLSLLKPTTQAEAALHDMGTSSAELRAELKEKGLLATLRDLETRFQGNDEAASLVFGNVRALRGALSLLGLDAEQLDTIFQHTAEATDNLGRAYDATEGTSREYGRAIAELNVLLIQLSEDVLPIAVDLLRDIAGVARTLAGFWRELNPETRGIVVRMLALAAVAGPLLLVFGKLTSGFGLLLRTFGTAGRFITPAIKLFGKLGLTLATSLGKGLATSGAVNAIGEGLGSALGKVANAAPVKRATDVLGRALGSTIGKALGLGFAAVAVVVLADELLKLNNEIRQQQIKLQEDNAKLLAEGSRESVETALRAAEDALKNSKATQWDLRRVLFGSAAASSTEMILEDEIAKLKAKLATMPQEASKILADGYRDGGDVVARGAAAMVSGVSDAVAAEGDEAAAEAKKVGGYVSTGVGAGILEAQGAVDSAMATLTNLIENERTPAQQASHVIGQLISKEVSNGVVSGRPGVRDAARSLRESGEQELRAFIAGGGKIGKKAMTELRDGMKSKDPEVRNQSKRTVKIIEQEQDKLKGIGKNAGKDNTQGVADGITSKKPAVRRAASGIRTTVTAQLPSGSEGRRWGAALISSYAGAIASRAASAARAAFKVAERVAAVLEALSPPGPESPLHLIDKWGERTIDAYADGMDAGAPRVRRAAYDAAEGAATALAGGRGINVPVNAYARVMAARAGIRAPDVPSMAATHASATALEHAQGVPFRDINVQTYGIPMRAETPAQVVNRIKRASRLGTVAPRPKPGTWEST